MTTETRPYLDLIRTLVPLDSLSEEGFSHVLERVRVSRIPKGEVIFERGDDDELSVYLLEGTIALDSGDRVDTVEGGSKEALCALSSLKPRHYTATTKSGVIIARIHTNTLVKILTWDQMAHPVPVGGYQVQDLSEAVSDTEWMIQTLRTPAFLKLPAANIQTVLGQFEELQVKQGDVVIKEGDPGDYFYLIKHGSCRVSRTSKKDGREVVFDRMRDGDAFGEDALVSERPRNATITMTSDGVLMRLSKEYFSKLMQEPLIRWAAAEEAAALMKAGAEFLDVRLPAEYRNGSIKNSRNLPLYLLRLKADELKKSKKYIVFCDTGARSAAAAFLLTERGFDVQALKGGLAALISRAK